MKRVQTVSLIIATTFFTACGSSGNSSTKNRDNNLLKTGYFIDGAVKGLAYSTSSGEKGLTDDRGVFKYKDGDKVKFSIGKLKLWEATPNTKGLITPKILSNGKKDVENLILRTLQSLDSDKNTSNGIIIPPTISKELENLDKNVEISSLDENKLLELDNSLKNQIDRNSDGVIDVNSTEANRHFTESIQNFENNGSKDGDKNNTNIVRTHLQMQLKRIITVQRMALKIEIMKTKTMKIMKIMRIATAIMIAQIRPTTIQINIC